MRKFFKVTLYIIGGIIVLLLCAILYLNTPWGQNFVRSKAEAYLNKKLKTEVHIGHLGYGLPKYIVLDDVLFRDQAKDTLLSVGKLKVDIAMLKLLHKEVDVQQLVLEHVHAHIYRNAPDTGYNFTYIINAFASDKPADTTKPKDTTSSLKIDLARVRFDDIHIRFDDYTGGMRLAVNLDELDLKMKKLDLDKMMFHVKDLSIAGLETVFLQDTSYLPPKPKTNEKVNFQMVADNVHLQRINFKYDNNLDKFLFTLGLGDLQVALKRFDLANDLVDLDKLGLSNTDIVLHMGKQASAPAPIDTIVKKDTTEGWHVTARSLQLAGVNFKMDNDNQPHQRAGMDYSHLGVQGLTINAADILFTGDTIAGNIKHLAVKEQSGFDLRELRTVFNYNPQGATLRDLYLQTDNTILQNHLEVHYPSLAALKTRMQALQLRVNLQKSIIGIRDVLEFAPALAKQDLFRKNRNGHLKIDATLLGFLNSIDIKDFHLEGLSNTEVQLNGRLSGLPESKDISYNLHVSKLQSSRSDLSTLLPPSATASVRIPDRFGIMGQVAGTIKDYNTNLYLMSTDGQAYVKGTIAMSPGKGKEKYDLLVRTEALNVGRILKKDTLMGAVTASITAKGTSFDIKTMTATVTGDVAKAYVKGYNYHNITLDAAVASKQADLKLRSVDTNLMLNMTGHADFSGKYVAAKADIKLDSIDLQALHLYSSELRMHGDIHADFPELNPDYPKGEFVWKNPIFDANSKRYVTDSLYILSRPSDDTGQNIVLNFDILQAHITGKTPLGKIPDIIQDHINRHYTMNNDSTPKGMLVLKKKKDDTTKLPVDYDLKVIAHVIDRPLLHGLLPGLVSIDSIHLDADISPRNLVVNAIIPDLEYGTSTSIQNGLVQVRGTDSAFTYKVTVDQITQSKFELWYANIHGNLDQNKITTNISLSDSAKKERFALIASINKQGDDQVLQLEPGLKLNYKTWQVAQPNSITLAPEGFYVQNFQLSDSNEYIKINSEQQQPNTPIKIDISDFLLANLTDIISKGDTLLGNGLLGGSITLTKMRPALEVNGDLQIQNLSVLGDTIGDMRLTVNDNGNNKLNTKMTIEGEGNDISLDGAYNLQPGDGNALDFALSLKALNVHSIEGITMNQIHNTSGFLRGDIKIQGDASAPQITGSLHTDNLATTVTSLNAYFKMPNEKIDLTTEGVTFDNFTIQDSAGNKASLNGTIATADLTNMKMDMHIKADDWRALHSTVKDNKVFYGDLMLTTNMDISGTPTSPTVDGNLNILKGTNMTIVMPDSDPEQESSKGIVKFVNLHDSSRDNILIPKKKRDSTHKVRLAAGSNINVNVNVDKNAQFSLIIDQASGDFISVRGDASLNASVAPGGGIALAGSYELHEGAYQLNYNFIKRKFSIKDGSTITFAGDPTKGTNIDLTAVYEAQIAPYDLVQREVPDPSQLNYYKENLPFDIELHMKGPVLQPAITFDVVLPDNKVYPLSSDQIELIQGKLNQLRNDTSELNKQVFAVLILNRFVADDPFSSSTGGVGNTALQSVSRFIGEQLNQAAGNLIKGVDLSVDLATTDDYTTGDMRQRTDLNLAASKRLLNDRLKITIGNDFELEGPQPNNSDANNVIPSNLSADYLLSADGRYSTQAYRKNYNEGVLQGYVTETGLNFIVSLDFNHFRNAFRKRKKESSMVKSTPTKGADK